MQQQPIGQARPAVEQAGGQLHSLRQQRIDPFLGHLQQGLIQGSPGRIGRAGATQQMHLLNQLPDALAPAGTHGQHGDAERLAQARRIDLDAEAARLIAHVQRHQHRQGEGLQLQQQAQLAGDLAGVEHQQQQIGRGVAQKALHHRLVLTAAAEVVDARQVHQLVGGAAGISRHRAPQQLHREPGPVGDFGIAAGEAVVEGGLAGVGHAQQGHRDAAARGRGGRPVVARLLGKAGCGCWGPTLVAAPTACSPGGRGC